MYRRYLMVASAALAFAGAAAAEPAKPAEKPAATQPANNRPAEVVLASAEQISTPAVVDQAQSVAPAKKPRAARVTTCRCAGQTGQNDQ